MKNQKIQNKIKSAEFCHSVKHSGMLGRRLITLSITFLLMISAPLFIEVGVSAKASLATASSTTSPSPENTILIKDQTIPEENAQALKKLEKKGEQNWFVKFLTAMFGVLFSAAAIFFGLRLYKKFFLKEDKIQASCGFEKSFESPKDFKEAINLFLDKTDK